MQVIIHIQSECTSINMWNAAVKTLVLLYNYLTTWRLSSHALRIWIATPPLSRQPHALVVALTSGCIVHQSEAMVMLIVASTVMALLNYRTPSNQLEADGFTVTRVEQSGRRVLWQKFSFQKDTSNILVLCKRTVYSCSGFWMIKLWWFSSATRILRRQNGYRGGAK